MRVLVTGGTGHVGAHIVAALLDAGHAVRVLARNPERVGAALGPFGRTADDVETVGGDVLDGRDALAAALDGVDALLHGANVYSLNQADAERMREVNVDGTRSVLQLAAECGLAPIVHVSSYVALMPCEAPMTSATPTGDPEGPYLESKAEAERIALGLAEHGAEVVVTNPGFVLGPHDPYLGESTGILHSLLTDPVSSDVPGTFPVVDVRDVAVAHARIFDLERPAPRYLLAGRPIADPELRDLAHEVTGRRLPLVPTPTPLVRLVGRVADVAQRRGIDPGFSSMNVYSLEHGVPVDDGADQEALGLRWRPMAETIGDTITWLYRAGHLSDRQAGKLAAA
jgi:dihydroflavonol-4-reductase